ncbi:MAG: hypothetical protein ACXIUD_00475 [Mongoliitalea sp.]
MKLLDFILLSLTAAMVIIGTHLTITVGITTSYPVFMFAVAMLFWFQYRKNHVIKAEDNKPPVKPAKTKKKR